MTLDVPGVRPALFQNAEIGSVDDLRAFGHVFRNLYARRLDPAKLESVQRQAETALALFRTAHEAFTGKLRSIAGMIGTG